MNNFERAHRLPDVAAQQTDKNYQALQWVGMTRLPVVFEMLDSRLGNQRCQGYAEVGVDLVEPSARGIHMSRLYLGLETFCREQSLSPQSLQHLLTELVDTHKDISQAVSIGLDFELMLNRPALESDLKGFKSYPVRIHAWKDRGDLGLALELTVPYSSTCPCSTSLAKAHIKESLSAHFSSEQLNRADLFDWLDQAGEDFPTPHSQRSYARVRVQLTEADKDLFNIVEWLDSIEDSLQTAVQTAVKREDELAFAKRNGANLMFCEDAARRLQKLLDTNSEVSDYWLEIDHQESLHAHNAVARASKNGGLSGLYTWYLDQNGKEG